MEDVGLSLNVVLDCLVNSMKHICEDIAMICDNFIVPNGQKHKHVNSKKVSGI